MKRVFWGLVKIAIIILLLVWVVRWLFPVSNQEKSVSETIKEQLQIAVPSAKEILSVKKNSVPKTLQQKKYALYSEKAGMPEAFTAEVTLKGTEAISAQLARAFDEPLGEWGNLSVHKKTFWVLAELTLQDINVDLAQSLNGAVLTVKKGSVSIDLSEVSITSFPALTLSSPGGSFASVTVDTREIESPLPSKKTLRRMSGRSWQKVLEAGTR